VHKKSAFSAFQEHRERCEWRSLLDARESPVIPTSLDCWRFATPRALGLPRTLTGLADTIVIEEVPPNAASLFASAILISLGTLDPKQRGAQEKELSYQKETLHPIRVGSVLVRFSNCALLAVLDNEVSRRSAARHHQFGVGVRGGVKIAEFMDRAALGASPN
jgi:hypothetical protein